MPTYVEQIDLPYTPPQVFDLVADIESYPRFLPHCASARITRRSGNKLSVEQVVNVKMLRLKFSTRAVLDPPVGIHVVCADSPFGSFSDRWTFADRPGGGTRLRCHTEFTFRSRILQIALGGAVGDVLKETVEAFRRRADQLYGAVDQPPLPRPVA